MSVGNLSVGGMGKTPVVAAIAQWLIERGERPSILSRGYKRQWQVDGVVVVSDGTRVLVGVDEAGDEPLMLARQVPGAAVCVCTDRHLAGVLAERRLGCSVHVLDDGFQHLRLARDLDVIVTAPGEIPHGRVLPLGRLREPMEAASRAQLVIVADATEAEAQSEAWALGISQFAGMRRRQGVPRWINEGGEPLSTQDPVVAVAGIAHPTRFFDALEAAGFHLAGTLPLSDHHAYTARDLQTIGERLHQSRAAAIVTTEKDAVKLEALQPLPFPLAAVPLELEFDPWTNVTGVVEAALARARGAA